MRFLLVLGLISSITPTTASAGVNDQIEKKGQYWQRVNVGSALYLRGPKAQQMLNRDIARCVVELRELERLGAVKNAIPEYAEGLVLSKDEARLKELDFPERDKDLYAEHSDFIDFEGCMLSKGWQRIKYVPFDVAKEAQINYKRTHTKYRDQERKKISGAKHSSSKRENDYSNLND